jgi:cytoskeleton protein RodZ
MTFSGDRLRQERELRGISLREVSDATKISVRFLEAIEQDRFEILPGGVFPRAFVKQYAEQIGLDGEAAMLEFVSTYQMPIEEDSPRTRGRRTKPKGQGLRRLGVLAAAAALLALGLGLWPGATRSRGSAAAVSAVPRLPVVKQEAATPPSAVEAQPRDDQALVMVLRADADCWVEVRADGRAVLNRVLSQGESAHLEATDEFRLSVGNAGGLSFSVNDLPGLPLGRSGEVRRNIVITRESLSGFIDSAGRADSPFSG